MRQLIILRGTPGSGKSTLAKHLEFSYDAEAESDCDLLSVHLEADQFFVGSDGVYRYDGMKIGEAHAWCQRETEKCLEQGRTVIVSNTFTTIKELRPYFEMIQKYGQNPVVYTVQSAFKNVHGVPDEVLAKMKARFVHDISELFV